MGKKTSVYLTDSVLAQVTEDGGKLPDILLAGLAARRAERDMNVARLIAETRTQAGTDPFPPEARPARIMIPESEEPVAVVATVAQCPHRNWGRFCVRCDALISDTGYPVLG